MRAMEIQGAFGIDNVRLAERAVPKAGPGQVVIRMKAASLMVRAIEANDIHPVIDKRFALEELPAALKTMQGASHFGKIVLSIG